MTEITYLLGAGASAKALPIVNQIKYKVGQFLADIEKLSEKNIDEFVNKNKDINKIFLQTAKDNLINDVNWLIQQFIGNEFTIDELAREFSRNQPENLNRLKFLITFIFLYLQNTNLGDLRYKQFLNYIVDKYEPNSKIKIITWNYDLQIEKAYGNLIENNSLVFIQDRLNVCPRSFQKSFNYSPDKFNVFKLNGTTSLNHDGINSPTEFFPPFEKKDKNEIINNLLNLYSDITVNPMFSTNINFAWEVSELSKRVIKIAKDCTINTEVLVVIGYSFPIFNIDIDKEILNNMKNLKKVYIQDINPEYSSSQFKDYYEHSKEVDIISMFKVDKFHIPNEFSLKI